MAHSFAKPSLILRCLLLPLFISFGVSLFSSRIVHVDHICARHTNSASCAYILNSIEGVADHGADPNTLSPIVIDLAADNAFKFSDQIQNLKVNTTDPHLYQRYASCLNDYNDASGDLDAAKQAFSVGNYAKMNSKGNIAMEEVQDCNSIPDASGVPMNNSYLVDVSEIVTILADILAGIY